MYMAKNRCDRFAEAHYRHNNNERYIFEGDIKKFERELRAFEQENGESEIEF
jgi:hypothetical protein